MAATTAQTSGTAGPPAVARTYGAFIDGRFVDPSGDDEIEVVNPATEAVVGRVGAAVPADVDRAVAAARAAFESGPWADLDPRARSRILVRFAEGLEARRDELVELIIAEAGATRSLAESGQTERAFAFFRHWAERTAAFPFVEPIPPFEGARLAQGTILKEPVGVVAAITPFNFPLLLNLFKLGPALGMGNTVVLKPSPYTPLSAFVIAEVAAEIGLPDGVLNVLVGDVDAGRALTTHADVDMVAFTGSDAVGKRIMEQAAPTLKRVLLELGGKSPNVIFADADLEAATALAASGFVRHCGQGCGTPTRILVEESVHDAVVEGILASLATVDVGDPADPATTMGPLIREVQRARVEEYVESGVREGATIAHGGGRPPGMSAGFFVEPTLFTGVDNAMAIAQDEIFGPVAAVIPFADEAEAVRIANDSRYGLAAWVWSRDTARAYRVARRLRVGTVNVNGTMGISPDGTFGGYKHSGLGREFSDHGLHEYVELKTVYWPVG